MPSLAEPVVERLLAEFQTGLESLREMPEKTEDAVRDLVLDFCFCSRLIRTDLRTIRGARKIALATDAVRMFIEAHELLAFLITSESSLSVYVDNIKERATQLQSDFDLGSPAGR